MRGLLRLAGGGLQAGSISIASGGALLVSKSYSYTGSSSLAETITDNGAIIVATSSTDAFTGNITGTGSVTVEHSSIVTFGGSISETGPITIQDSANVTINGTVSGDNFTIGNSAVLDIASAVTGTSGSFTLMNSANLEFGAAESENIGVAAGATGTLKFDKSASVTGSISGLTRKNAVDLGDLDWVSGKMKATFAANAANPTSGGVLTVTNGTNSAELNLLGNYTKAAWNLSKDGSGGTLVVDPPVDGSLTPDPAGGAQGQIDLPDISFGADTMLGYSENSDNTGGILTVGDGNHAASLALMGQYMASSFVAASDGHGGTLITDPPLTPETMLGRPQHA